MSLLLFQISFRFFIMRVKNLLAQAPILDKACSKVRLFWDRITATRLTTIYFTFSIVHCLVQAFLQGDAFQINARAASYLTEVTVKGNSDGKGFYVWQHDELRFCTDVPKSIDSSSCALVWSAKDRAATTTTESLGASSDSSTYAQSDAVQATHVSSVPSSAVISQSLASSSTSSDSAASTLTVATVNPAPPPTTAPSLSPITSTSLSSTAFTATRAAPSPPVVAIISEDDDDDEDDEDDNDGEEEEKERKARVIVITPSKRHFSAEILNSNPNGTLPVVLNGWGYKDTEVLLSTTCLDALNWPVQELDNTKREDIAFISFQFWVLGMSIVAILNESIPHIIASLLTHLSATAWGGFQLAQTNAFHKDFGTVLTRGACGVNLLPTYWKSRANVEIPSLILNCVALIASVVLSWRLIKTFGWQTFKRVGASRTINRVYKLVLTLSVAIQLSLFFVVVSVALWLDQICNGAIGRLATAHKVYESLLIIVLLMLPVWLLTGWFAVRRESKIPMTIFLVLCVGYIAGWGAMFDSTTFRWTLSQWSFFAAMMVAGFILVMICFTVGVFCRLNFGRGLPHHLNAEEPLPGDDFERVFPNEKGSLSDPEKIDFPTNFGAVPTYEAAYGYDDEVPPPPGTRSLGPRFYSQDNAPISIDSNQITGPQPVNVDKFVPMPYHGPFSSIYEKSQPSLPRHGSEITAPPSVHSRTDSEWTTRSGLPASIRPLVRKGSASSNRSHDSTRSGNSTTESSQERMRPRWVIE